jgi:hypothetical protein
MFLKINGHTDRLLIIFSAEVLRIYNFNTEMSACYLEYFASQNLQTLFSHADILLFISWFINLCTEINYSIKILVVLNDESAKNIILKYGRIIV